MSRSSRSLDLCIRLHTSLEKKTTLLTDMASITQPGSVQVKVKFGDDVRRLTLSADISFVALRQKLNSIFGTSLDQLDQVLVKYEDNDGDQITISCDEELQEAIRQAQLVSNPAQQILRLALVRDFSILPNLIDTPVGVTDEQDVAAAPPPPPEVPAPAQDDFILVDERTQPAEQFTPPTPLPEPSTEAEQPETADDAPTSADDEEDLPEHLQHMIRTVLENTELLQAVDDVSISGPLYHALPSILSNVFAVGHCCGGLLNNPLVVKHVARLLPEVLSRLPHIAAALTRDEVRQILQQQVPEVATVLYQYLDSNTELWAKAASELAATPPTPFNFFTLLPLLRHIAPLLPADVEIDLPTEVPAAAAFQRHRFPGCGRLWDFAGHFGDNFWQQPPHTAPSTEQQSSSGQAVHDGVTCDVCGASPITGVRYKCTVCHDYDLCAKCEATGQHDERHPLIKMNQPKGPAVHRHVACDGCNQHPIVGPRFKCTVCHNFDLCVKCEASGVHDPSHAMIKMAVPPERSRCPRMPHHPFLGGFGGGRRWQHCPRRGFGFPSGAPWFRREAAAEQEKQEEQKQDKKEDTTQPQSPQKQPVPTPTPNPAPAAGPQPTPAPGAQATAPPLPPRVHSNALEEQLKQLADMGFIDRETNIRLLRQFRGNTQLVVNSLLGV